ncbi:MAG: hypothetical protein WKG07_35735 [Hymenobacter sp.]
MFFISPRPKEELYDCRKDPLQLVNVVSSTAHAAQLEKLRQLLQQWQLTTEDSDAGNLTKDWYDRETGSPLKTRGNEEKCLVKKRQLQPSIRDPFSLIYIKIWI